MTEWVVKLWKRFSDDEIDDEIVVIVEKNGKYYDGVEFHATEKLELREYLIDLVGKIIHSLRDGSREEE